MFKKISYFNYQLSIFLLSIGKLSIFLFKPSKNVLCFYNIFLAIWSWESSIEILLAMNRCVEVDFSKHSDRIYGGYRTWLWILPTGFYALYIFLFEKPTVFSGIGFAWFFSPFIGIRNLSAAEIDVILWFETFQFESFANATNAIQRLARTTLKLTDKIND